jgi:hypothetical protein
MTGRAQAGPNFLNFEMQKTMSNSRPNQRGIATIGGATVVGLMHIDSYLDNCHHQQNVGTEKYFYIIFPTNY